MPLDELVAPFAQKRLRSKSFALFGALTEAQKSLNL